jgi:hypothetical protein
LEPALPWPVQHANGGIGYGLRHNRLIGYRYFCVDKMSSKRRHFKLFWAAFEPDTVYTKNQEYKLWLSGRLRA